MTNIQPASILTVTVTQTETQAVLTLFPKVSGTPWNRQTISDKTYYFLGQIGSSEVYMVQSEMGIGTPGGALITVHTAIEALHPMAVIMVGIAFGAKPTNADHPKNPRLGDILVAKQIMYYEPSKVKGKLFPRGDRVTASTKLLSKFRSACYDWKGAPVHFGLMLSGEKLVNDPALCAELLNLEPEAIGGEMEGAGLYVAASEAKVDWILVKAICDWADGNKNDDTQLLAAQNAARFVLHVIQLGDWNAATHEKSGAPLVDDPIVTSPRRKTVAPKISRRLVVGIVAVIISVVLLFLAVQQFSNWSPIYTLAPGATQIAEKDGMTLVYVPAGEFLMGSDKSKDPKVSDDELPQHKVYLDAFWIDRTLVSNTMFRKFVQEANYRTDAEKGGWGYIFDSSSGNWTNPKGTDWQHPHGSDSNLSGLDDHPVVQVSWNDAQAYCQWAGRRLPTEAEWEKAARGTDRRIYPWGNQALDGSRANFADRNFNVFWADKNVDDGYQFTSPVGNYQAGASPYGALDMAGNVYEWVADWFSDNYYNQSPLRNPLGPDSPQQFRAMRGGSWFNWAWVLRAAHRGKRVIDDRVVDLGFRCAR